MISVKPIPTLGRLHFTFSSNSDEQVNIEVINMLGELLLLREIVPSEGINELVLELETIQSGIYYLSLYNAKRERVLRKIIKQ